MVDEQQQRKSPWDWPLEWSRDESFWREVATRTVAGILTLIFLGTPLVLYAMFSRALTPDQGVPILIGAGEALLVLAAYIAGSKLAHSTRLKAKVTQSLRRLLGAARLERTNLGSNVANTLRILVPIVTTALAAALGVWLLDLYGGSGTLADQMPLRLR